MVQTTPIPRWRNRAEAATDQPGAYALLITLNQSVALPDRFRKHLGRGRYIYLGSAKAGGGIRARVARHLIRSKNKHWHVDWLTTRASSVSFIDFPGGDECDLTATLLRAGLEPPVKGLGSSDCLNCPSHLLKLPSGLKRSELAVLLAD